jgi:hypothetical protein
MRAASGQSYSILPPDLTYANTTLYPVYPLTLGRNRRVAQSGALGLSLVLANP